MIERPTRTLLRLGPISLLARPGATPVALWVTVAGLVAAPVISLLNLDRLPITLCSFKAMTGLPCPTCGATRSWALLARLDPLGAFLMNPIVVLLTLGVAALGLWELLLLRRSEALELWLAPAARRPLLLVAVVALLANWVFLLRAGR
jgi:hypothetical protein